MVTHAIVNSFECRASIEASKQCMKRLFVRSIRVKIVELATHACWTFNLHFFNLQSEHCEETAFLVEFITFVALAVFVGRFDDAISPINAFMSLVVIVALKTFIYRRK